MTESITARLSDLDIKAIDALVKAGLFTTRSDFLRAAARKLLREESPQIPELFLKLQLQAKKKHLNRKDMLIELRKVRKELYQE
jgi:Arc/MetJ-type ribon-helix-helix transcriptional regulator